MLKLLSAAVPILVALYTVLFGLDNLRQKNYSATIALMVLALTIAGLPVYILFFKG